MRRLRTGTIIVTLPLAFLAAGCGGGSMEPGTAAGLAVVTATLEADPAVRRAGRTGLAAPVEVVAVDETGVQVDAAQGVTGELSLDLPVGHDYSLIFSDTKDSIGALVYGDSAGERADFRVRSGVSRLDLGVVTVDPEGRRVRAESSSAFVRPPDAPAADLDRDGIPDRFDEDDDNDGIPDTQDVSPDGLARSRDHDNDGISDDGGDEDLDGDGIVNRDDGRPRDFDNDGEDDDRDLDDDESVIDHPRHGAGALGNPQVGQAVYQDERNVCVGCHGETGGGATVAPESIRGTSIGHLAEALASGAGDEDGFMPVFTDLVKFAPDIAAFLRSSARPSTPGARPGPAPDGDGRSLYDTACAECHRLGSYDSAGLSPDLAGLGNQLDDKLAAGHHRISPTAEGPSALERFLQTL